MYLWSIMFNIGEIYRVSDFLSLCNKTIEGNIPICWLQGEISNLSRPASGHWYFSLKDNEGQIRCALFRLNQRHIKFNPENGLEVLVLAAPTLYQVKGDFQLIIQRIESVGVGNLNLAFEQLKKQLKDEGLFDAIHKKPLPAVVHTIGVISSSNGAVIRDIVKILNKRYPFAKVLLFDCVVQGEGAAEKIAYAIKQADKSGRCDVLIVARGGGSLEDLWAFNEVVVARAIFATKTPIISAIGHETDTTIADFVSDMRAPTPSAAAMLATPDRLALLSQLSNLSNALVQYSQQTHGQYQQQLTQLRLNLSEFIKPLNLLAQKIDALDARLCYQIKINTRLQHSKISTIFERLKQYSPNVSIAYSQQLNISAKQQLTQNIGYYITQQKNAFANLILRLNQSTQHQIWQQKNQLSNQVSGLNHLSPLATLTRGYSITQVNSRVLSSTNQIKIGTSISTLLHKGRIYSRVEKIEKS